MPRKVVYWACIFCGNKMPTKSEAKQHEKQCLTRNTNSRIMPGYNIPR